MFRFRKSQDIQDIRDRARSETSGNSALRRAVGLLPEAPNDAAREVKDTMTLRFHHLLISLEGTERTGCLKIVSTKHKSRSAILLYKGRVLGCVYGQKNMVRQYLAHDAHKLALSDLASPGNLVDAYELSDDIVLATGSLFNGQNLDIETSANAQHMFEQATGSIMRSGLPGCIVVNNLEDEILLIAYLANGRIVGIHNAQHGWVAANIESANKLLRQNQHVKIFASVLPIQQGQDPGSLSFSLTGLADRPHQAQYQLQAIDAATSAVPHYMALPAQSQGQTIPAGSIGLTRSGKAAGRSHFNHSPNTSTFAISPR